MTQPGATPTEPQTVILFINRTDSECGACGRGANPHEKAHITALGYFAAAILDDPNHPAKKGCGAMFTAVSTRYTDMDADVAEMRPDLPFIDPMRATFGEATR